MNILQKSSHSNKEKSNYKKKEEKNSNEERKMNDFFLHRRRSLARPKGEGLLSIFIFDFF